MLTCVSKLAYFSKFNAQIRTISERYFPILATLSLRTMSDSETKKGQSSTANNLSKRSQRKLLMKEERNKIRLEKKRQERIGKDVDFNEDWLEESDYYEENGLRKVHPYYFTFAAYAKGRWFGRTLMDVFETEFRQDNPHDKIKALEQGRVKINGNVATEDYILKQGDYVENTIHRHEVPVQGGDLKIVHEDDEVIVIDKPSSVPVHPCGRYRHNSLTFMMRKLYGYKNLRTVYRLDRLTSGVYIFCKNDIKTREIINAIQERKVQKEYISCVDGEFPKEKIECNEPIGVLSFKLGLQYVTKDGKEACTYFERISTNGKKSIVKCWPKTGRTHQIRVHLQYLGYPITNDKLYNTPNWGPERGRKGNFGQANDVLLDRLEKEHSSRRFLMKDSEEAQAKRVKYESSGKYDENCQECLHPSRDPVPEELVMYLHALSYEGPNWKYSTSLPSWADLDTLPDSKS